MNRLIENIVFCELVTAWRFAAWPTRRSPVFVNATTEGVVRAPSLFSKTTGSPPSITDMHELVVPRSIPKTLAIYKVQSSLGLFSIRCSINSNCISHWKHVAYEDSLSTKRDDTSQSDERSGTRRYESISSPKIPTRNRPAIEHSRYVSCFSDLFMTNAAAAASQSANDITFACIHCSSALVVDAAAAGMTLDCQRCGQPTPVPNVPVRQMGSAESQTKVADLQRRLKENESQRTEITGYI